MYQLVFPFGNVMAAANSSLLPPSNLAYQSLSPDDGRLTWTSVAGATGYNVYEIKDGQLVLLGKSTTSSYSLNNLPEGSFRYVVSTLDTDGESGPTAPVSTEIIYPEMTAPETLTSTIRNGNDIVLSWGASQYVDKYNVYQITGEGEKTLLTSTTASSYTIAKSAEGTFTYAVTADNTLYGESPISLPLDVKLIYPVMTQPADQSFTITNGADVTLKWQPVEYATSYKIYELINGQFVLKSTVTGTSVKYTNLPAGDYQYKVFSSSDRFGESVNGSEVSLTVSSIVMTPPIEVTYKIQNINDVVLSWGAVPYATGYKVYQIVEGNKVLKNTVTGTSVTQKLLPAGDYQYEVYSYSDRFGESEVGTKVSFTIDTYKMSAPSNPSYKIQNGNDIVLNWGASEYATNYNIYKIIEGQKVLERTVTGTSATFTNQGAGDYVYEVYSYSSRFGESEAGSQITLKLEPIIISAPENVSYELRNENDIALSWSAVEYASSYNIYQIIDGEKVLKRNTTGTNTIFSNMPEGNYSYEIHSVSSRFGESIEGADVVLEVVHPDMNPPANVAGTVKSPTSFTISWGTVDYATSYKVYQIVNGEKVLKNTIAGTSVTYNNMLPGEYHYEIYSYSTRFGESQAGKAIVVVLEDQSLPAPENFSFSLKNGNDITLKWDAVQYASSYKVYQMINSQFVLKRTVTGASTTFTNMPEGSFAFVVKADSTLLGESPKGSEVQGTIEFPNMSKPENLTSTISNGNDITLRWNAITYATAYNIYQIIDGERVFIKSVTGTATTMSNLPEGNFTYEVHSYSDRFGESPEGSKNDITIVYPIMQQPENLTNTINNGNDIVLRWNASSYATEYRIYQVINSEKILVKTSLGTSTSFANMPEGDYHYVVHSYSDRFGESPEGNEIKLNLTWPVVQAPVLTGKVFNANNITLSWSSVTWANEYRVYKVNGNNKELLYKGTARSYNANNLTEETHSFEVTAYSTRFGESVPSNQVKETIVYPIMEAPAATLKLLSETSARISWDFVTYANGYNIYEIIDGNPVLLAEKVNNLSYTLQNLTYANHEYYVTSYSNSFGESVPSETVIAKLIIDNVAPVTKINAPTQWVNENQIVTLEATDDETGVAKTFYSLNDNVITEGTSISVDQEGINKIAFNSIDKVGNMEQVKTAFVKIDKTAPKTDMNEIPSYSQSFTVQLTGKDELSGVAKTYYSINGSEYVEGTTVVIEVEGTNEISYYSVDEAGNIEEVNTTEIKIDKTAPKTSHNAPEGWVKEDVPVTLTPSDELSGAEQTYYSINGSEYKEGQSFTLTDEGVHEITFYSVDQAGNKEEKQVTTVKIDKTAPTISIDLEKEYELGSTFNLDYLANDNLSGMAVEEVTLNGKSYKKGDQISLDEPGEYKLVIKGTDVAGWATIVEEAFVVYIPVTLEVLPKVIKENKGIFTVKAILPSKYQTAFDVSTVTLNGVSAVTDNKGLVKQAEKGHFKFDREDFDWETGDVNLEFRGYLDNQYLVVAKTTVEVKGNKKDFFNWFELIKSIIEECGKKHN